MVSELLKCLICPKSAKFSDVSHLLTHVSSKGHLANLHKLQVRSHQDIAAGHQLESYNTWYQDHDMAQMLSERLQHKEAKRDARRPRRPRTKGGPARHEPVEIYRPNLFENDLRGTAYELTTPTASSQNIHVRRKVMQQEMDDPEYVSITRTGAIVDYLLSSPSKRSLYPDLSSTCADVLTDHMGSPAARSPEHIRLKGRIWPGMNMFDAATQEAQRKRNQRKDSSIVRHMETNSAMIEPVEIVYSPRGTLKRQRHMDDLENDEDLLEGETPIKRPSAKRGRKPLAQLSVNKPTRGNYGRRRLPSRRTEVVDPPPVNQSTGATAVSSSSLHGRVAVLNPLRLLRSAGKSRITKVKPRSAINVYADKSPEHQDDSPPYRASAAFEPVVDEHVPAHPMQFTQASWLRPQAQMGHTYNPLKFDPDQLYITNHEVLNDDQEDRGSLNWKQEDFNQRTPRVTIGSFDGYNDFDLEFSPLKHVVAFTQNPLMITPTPLGAISYGDPLESPAQSFR